MIYYNQDFSIRYTEDEAQELMEQGKIWVKPNLRAREALKKVEVDIDA